MKRTLIFRLFFLTLFGILVAGAPSELFAQSKKDQSRADKLVAEGNKAFNRKDYKQAGEKYAEAIKLVPTHPEAHFWKGYTHLTLKENDQALTEFDLALVNKYEPAVNVYKQRWKIHYDNKNYDLAMADIRRIESLEPGNTAILVPLGDISYSKGDFNSAQAAYQKAVLTEPSNGDIYYSLARVYSSTGNTESQLSAAQEALKRNTQFRGEAYLLIGEAYFKMRRLTDAAEAYKQALIAKPGVYDAYRRLARIYESENRFTDAIDISRMALRHFPNDGDIYTDLSWYYSLAARNDDAIQAALAGIKLKPGNSVAHTNLCRAYNDTKQYQSAILACNDALKIAPGDGEASYYLGRAFDLLNKPNEATKHYKNAVTGLLKFTSDNPGRSDGFYLLGNAYFADNQRDKAIEAYNTSLQLSPRFSKARYNLGIIHVLQKDKAAALEQYNSLMSIDADLAAKLKAEIDRIS